MDKQQTGKMINQMKENRPRQRDWESRVKRLVFPFRIKTQLRSDMILYPISNKLLIKIDLTVIVQSKLDKAFEWKNI